MNNWKTFILPQLKLNSVATIECKWTFKILNKMFWFLCAIKSILVFFVTFQIREWIEFKFTSKTLMYNHAKKVFQMQPIVANLKANHWTLCLKPIKLNQIRLAFNSKIWKKRIGCLVSLFLQLNAQKHL